MVLIILFVDDYFIYSLMIIGNNNIIYVYLRSYVLYNFNNFFKKYKLFLIFYFL